MIELGDLAKDTITGFIGVVRARTMYLHNCDRLALMSKDLKDGKPMDNEWFDELQVELVSRTAIPVVKPIPMTVGLGDTVADTLSSVKEVGNA